MNLYNNLSDKDIELLKINGKEIEDREYSYEEIRKILVDIEDEIMSCSTKNNDINDRNKQYHNVINILEKSIVK